MVITGLTRNQLSGSYRTKGSNPLPSAKEKPVIKPISGFFFCCFFAQVVGEHLVLFSPKNPLCCHSNGFQILPKQEAKVRFPLPVPK